MFTDLFELGFGLGAGLAAVAAPITAAVVLIDHALDRQARGRRAAGRRYNQESPVEGDKILSWGTTDAEDTAAETD